MRDHRSGESSGELVRAVPAGESSSELVRALRAGESCVVTHRLDSRIRGNDRIVAETSVTGGSDAKS